ncbi:hypothetical protein [Corynebacterium flavescens]|uniref:hypothetical protein n=1 Tax=Corynebacterium flavescens TaxID=28028 RepID=UPI003FD2CD56
MELYNSHFTDVPAHVRPHRRGTATSTALLLLGAVSLLALGACSSTSQNASGPTSATNALSAENSTPAVETPGEQQAINGFDALRQQGSDSMAHAPQPTLGEQAPDTGAAGAENPVLEQSLGAPAAADDGTGLREEIKSAVPGDQAAGFPVSVEGRAATMCTMGNGYGIGFIMSGNGQTSCGFANAVGAALIAQAGQPSASLRSMLPMTVTTTSPATNEAYDMSCTTQARGLIVCSGGNSAEVLIA